MQLKTAVKHGLFCLRCLSVRPWPWALLLCWWSCSGPEFRALGFGLGHNKELQQHSEAHRLQQRTQLRTILAHLRLVQVHVPRIGLGRHADCLAKPLGLQAPMIPVHCALYVARQSTITYLPLCCAATNLPASPIPLR